MKKIITILSFAVLVLASANINEANAAYYQDGIEYPYITDVHASEIASNSATIQWSADVASYGKISYGLKSYQLYDSAYVNHKLLNHSFSLKNLEADTVYYYVVSSSVDGEYFTNSEVYSFRTPAYALDLEITYAVITSNGLEIAIKNSGEKASTEAFVVSLYDPVGQTYVEYEEFNDIIPAGGLKTMIVSRSYGKPNLYPKLYIKLDHDNRVEESDENNNRFYYDYYDNNIYPGYYIIFNQESYSLSDMAVVTIKNAQSGINYNEYIPYKLDVYIAKDDNNINEKSLVRTIDVSKEYSLNLDLDAISLIKKYGVGYYSVVVCSNEKGCSLQSTNSAGFEVNSSLIKSRSVAVWPDKAVIQWQTDEAAGSIVYYVKENEDSWSWQGNDNLTTIHSVILPNLEASSRYEYFISSKTSNGEIMRSENSYFNTSAKTIVITDPEIDNIKSSAAAFYNNDISGLLSVINISRRYDHESSIRSNFLQSLNAELNSISDNMQNAIIQFTAYGYDRNTYLLGSGERAAVIYSYYDAYGRLPQNESDLEDVFKIASGRWPGTLKPEAEKKAADNFKKIYKRIYNGRWSEDERAIVIMTYGLRQKANYRNLESEKNGIRIFASVYGHAPKTTKEWNIMQAITYSGATRMIDTDGDLLPDKMEDEIGTNKYKKDTDGDGFSDGEEVESGHNPLSANK